MSRLSGAEVQALDPYAFLALLGKRVIHPGGRRSTDQLLEWAQISPSDRVLDVGCGVGTTAIRIGRETGGTVVAPDISALMREQAERNVAGSRVANVRVEDTDVLSLARVCKPGGPRPRHRVLLAQRTDSRGARDLPGQVCPGLRFDSVEEWVEIYSSVGLTDLRTDTGPFEMMTVRGFVADEGWHAFPLGARTMTRAAYLKKMAWLMPRMSQAVPYLGYIVVCAEKPRVPARTMAP